MIVGTNWFLGYSHTSKAKDDFIRQLGTREHIAGVLKVYLEAGVDTMLGARPEAPHLLAAIKDAENSVGRKMTLLSTPTLDVSGSIAAADKNARTLDAHAAIGVKICMPHQQTTDALVDRRSHKIVGMDKFCAMIRERGMIPGLSTHMPETPVYADESNLDVAAYIQIYNGAGFLMQIEVDWVHRMIWNAKRPVITIKPMAAGRLHPLVGLAFNWATIRPIDMVCVGTMTADEAREVIDISLSVLENRGTTLELQRTRSKESVEKRQ
jgi:hypothetical protein